jgi:hypothetical protein
MSRRTMSLLGALLLGLLAVSGAFVLGMRTRSPRLLNAIRRFNRAVSNPRQMRSAVTVHEGHTYRVDRPRVLPIEAAAGHLSANDRRFHRLFGIDECLRVRRVEPQGAAHGQPRR